MGLSVDVPGREALDVSPRFRVEFCDCLYARANALIELTDAVLCAGGPVNTLVELSLTAEHGAHTAPCMRGWTAAGSNRGVCDASWPGCRCRR